jgi:hypothetical protein
VSRTGYLRTQERLADRRANERKKKHMGFATPSAPGEGINWADHKGALLLVEVLSQEIGVQTVHGSTDPVRANVSVIDGPGAGESYDDTLIFPKVLIGQTKGHVGEKVLGRLGQGNAKPGQSAPWMLAAATPEDIAKAEAFLAAKAPQVTSAAAPF